MIFQAVYSTGAGNNTAVFAGEISGTPTAIAIEGAASGAGDFGAFGDLTINDSGDTGFQSAIGSNLTHFADTGSGVFASAAKNGSMLAVPGLVVEAIFKPALASNGDLLTRANLVDGIGGVSNSNDTIIGGSLGNVIAREGDPSSIAGVNYGGLQKQDRSKRGQSILRIQRLLGRSRNEFD